MKSKNKLCQGTNERDFLVRMKLSWDKTIIGLNDERMNGCNRLTKDKGNS